MKNLIKKKKSYRRSHPKPIPSNQEILVFTCKGGSPSIVLNPFILQRQIRPSSLKRSGGNMAVDPGVIIRARFHPSPFPGSCAVRGTWLVLLSDSEPNSKVTLPVHRNEDCKGLLRVPSFSTRSLAATCGSGWVSWGRSLCRDKSYMGELACVECSLSSPIAVPLCPHQPAASQRETLPSPKTVFPSQKRSNDPSFQYIVLKIVYAQARR